MSQKCDTYMEKISDCLDQELNLPSDLEIHLNSCQQCRDFALMWSHDPGKNSLAHIARIPDQTMPPGSIADSVIRNRVQSCKSRKIHSLRIWGAVAAVATIATGVFLWDKADKPAIAQYQPDPVVAPTTPASPTFKLSEIDTKPLEIKVKKFTTLGKQALKQKGQTYANAVKGIRYLTVSLSDL